MEQNIIETLMKAKYLSDDKIIETNKLLKEIRSSFRVGRMAIYHTYPAYVKLLNEEPYIKVKSKRLNGAIHNDIVLIKLLHKREGRVEKVIVREINQYVGEYYLDKNIGYVKLDRFRYGLNIYIPIEYSKGAVEGHKVVVKLKERKGNTYIGEVIKILGHVNDIKNFHNINILSSVYSHNFNPDFPEQVMKEVEKIPLVVSEEEIKNRKDLRKERIFTIDGEDAKDHDDAISIKVLPNGNYKLYVHIADVSHYVGKGTSLYNEAYDRGTSLYLVDRVVPMLPPQLSNGICSLNENVDRLAITCEMKINNKGDVIDYHIYESVINSKKRMTYTDVNKILKEGIIVEGYEEFGDDLHKMADLVSILYNKREKRGSLNFDIPELKYIVDQDGNPLRIERRIQDVGENLIEEFMIAANETVANHIFKQNLPFIYRVHDRPSPTKITQFFDFYNRLGYKLADIKNKLDSQTLQKILKQFKEMEFLSRIIHLSYLLRATPRAKYQHVNSGHFGLASSCYTHFTSPIRRFPDLECHRLLKKYMKLKEVKIIKNETLETLCAHSSLKEYLSVECERDVNKYEAALYMRNYINQEFDGVISEVTEKGLFVLLSNLIEGMVYIDDMPQGFKYNENKLQFESEGEAYRIGDKVKVKVLRTSPEKRQIDLMISEK